MKKPFQFEIQEFEKFPEAEFQALADDTLSFHPFLRWEENLDEKAKAKMDAIKARRTNDYQLRLGVRHEGQLIAASHSRQMSRTDLFMMVSMVRPEYRGSGIYTAICKRVLEHAKAEGFQSVSSKHMITNNPILIAKLKLGFKICGLEVNAVNGTTLNMTYNLNEQMADALRFRAGEIFLLDEEQLHESFGAPR